MSVGILSGSHSSHHVLAQCCQSLCHAMYTKAHPTESQLDDKLIIMHWKTAAKRSFVFFVMQNSFEIFHAHISIHCTQCLS